MATKKTTKPATKKKSASTKKKITSYNAGPAEGVKQLAGRALSYGKKAVKAGAKTYVESEKRMLNEIKEGAKTVAKPFMPAIDSAKKIMKKFTVKNVSKALNKKSGNNRPSIIKNPNSDKFKNSGPKYARGGVAKKLKKYQSEGEVKATTPVAPKNETTVTRPTTTTTTAPTPAPAQRTVATAMQENIAAGMSPGQARRTAMKELGLKHSVDPNKVFDAVTTTGQVVHDVMERRNNANNNSGGGMSGPGEFQRKGGMVKRKLMKASKGVIVKKKTVKKYQPGGPTGRTKYEGPVTKEMTDINSKQFPETNIPFVSNAGSDMLKKYNENRDRRETGTGKTMSRGGATKKYMTGGMVNSNAKVSALKSAGSKGVRSGVNAAAKAAKATRGRTGGTSKAPKTATPKAKMGMIMKGKKC